MSESDVAHCATLVREHDFPRYASTLFVPPDTRRALMALYAFNLDVARISDQVSQPLPGEIRLQWWTDLLEGLDHGAVEAHPVAAELLRAIRVHELPVGPLLRLIEARTFDLYNDPMPTLTALEAYLDDTIATVFATSARIVAIPSERIEHVARHAGIAQGLVRVLRRLPRDASRRQLYLPQEILAQHGATDEQVFAGQATPGIISTCGQIIGVARTHLDAAIELMSELLAPSRRAFLPLAALSHDLAALERIGRDPFVTDIPASRLRVLWRLWRASKTAAFGG